MRRRRTRDLRRVALQPRAQSLLQIDLAHAATAAERRCRRRRCGDIAALAVADVGRRERGRARRALSACARAAISRSAADRISFAPRSADEPGTHQQRVHQLEASGRHRGQPAPNGRRRVDPGHHAPRRLRVCAVGNRHRAHVRAVQLIEFGDRLRVVAHLQQDLLRAHAVRDLDVLTRGASARRCSTAYAGCAARAIEHRTHDQHGHSLTGTIAMPAAAPKPTARRRTSPAAQRPRSAAFATLATRAPSAARLGGDGLALPSKAALPRLALPLVRARESSYSRAACHPG